MTDYTPQSTETEIWFDCKPSHAPRPAAVIAAEDAEAAAWDQRQQAWNRYEAVTTDANMDAYTQADHVWLAAHAAMLRARAAALNEPYAIELAALKTEYYRIYLPA